MDTFQRFAKMKVLSFLVLVLVLGLELSEGMISIWPRFEAAPVYATVLIWFSDTYGTALPWRTAPRDIRIMGWVWLIGVALSEVFFL